MQAAKMVQICRTMSFRDARALLGSLSYERWQEMRETGEVPPERRGRPHDEEAEARVLELVKKRPGASYRYLAQVLKLHPSKVMRVLERHGLTRFNDRLRYAGLDPQADVPSQLKDARQRSKQRRQVCPGWLVHIDQKLLTSTREDGVVRKVRAFAVIDNFSSFAWLHLCEQKSSTEAATALRAFLEQAPFPVHLCLSDNGLEFRGDFDAACRELRVEHRRTEVASPWSNGKVERLNRTLREWTAAVLVKYSRQATFEQIRASLLHRVDEYNRSPHFGKHNLGLSPLEVIVAEQRSIYSNFRELVHQAACFVPEGYALAPMIIDSHTGEVLSG